MQIKDIGEIGLISRLAKKTAGDPSVIKGIGDDAAVIKWTGAKYLLAACDMLVEDVHFTRRAATPFQIGWKAMARNISDIAAMGGVPRYALVSAGLDPKLCVSFADGLYNGLRAAASRFGACIIGGDTSRSKKIVIDVAVIGEVEKDKVAYRSGARPKDIILVTGKIGGSLRSKHLKFVPRVKESRAIVSEYKINSMIDVSDGLVIDLWRVLKASGAGAVIYESLIPVSGHAASFDRAITDGEDFELIFTMPQSEAKKLLASGLDVSAIGEITEKRYGYRLIYANGKEKKLGAQGYLHF